MYTFYKAVIVVNKIRELRSQRGMKQDDLAELLKCSRVTVSRYESGTRDPDITTICALCDVFGCTSDFLLGRSSRRDPELTPEEEQLLAAWAAAPAEIRAIIDTALVPYKKTAVLSSGTA